MSVLKNQTLVNAELGAKPDPKSGPDPESAEWYAAAAARLVTAVQDLSRARNIDEIMHVVRLAARELTGADGATFVLRDNDKCFYAEENAISPLWKGQRFPLKSCISGWTMLNKKAAVIEDIYADPRIPIDAYRPTFVKSLVMVPIRKDAPLGAIGNYWARRHLPHAREVEMLQALADATSVAIENAGLYAQLHDKIIALEQSNAELARFSWIASHDLKSPLRAIYSISEWLEEDLKGTLNMEARAHLEKLRGRVSRMDKLLDDTISYVRMEGESADLLEEKNSMTGTALADDVLGLVDLPPRFTVHVTQGFRAVRVPRIPLQQVLFNLIENAVRHHDRADGEITLDVAEDGAFYRFSVTDDGPGIPPEYRAKVFGMFQTLKPRDAREGSGMGLAIVRKALQLRGGEIDVSANTPRGSVFTFTWPRPLTGLREEKEESGEK